MDPTPPAELTARCAAIEMLAVDVDGVLTDGRIVMNDQGIESKYFYVRDGLGYALWHQAGKRSAILTGRSAPVVERRAAELKIHYLAQGLADKRSAFQQMLAQYNLVPEQVCYIGDDLVDLPVLRSVGLAAAPVDAVAEVRQNVHLITQAKGGQGAVREVVEQILKAQGRWHGLCELYEAPAISRSEASR